MLATQCRAEPLQRRGEFRRDNPKYRQRRNQAAAAEFCGLNHWLHTTSPDAELEDRCDLQLKPFSDPERGAVSSKNIRLSLAKRVGVPARWPYRQIQIFRSYPVK
jgi:hypothetical protein